MLQTLDPHSSFLDPRTYAQMRERQEGRYFGLGITIQVDRRRHHGRLAVRRVARVPEGCAARRRHRPDRRREREGDDQRRSRAAAAGPEGHAGQDLPPAPRLRPVDRTRSAARRDPHPDRPGRVPCSTATTGYVRLQDFAEQTDHDLSEALGVLTRDGMKRLLLDLRGNPGGPLDQAIKVSNQFLPQGDADRLHARPGSELGSGLPGDREERLHVAAPRGAGEPWQRERVGDRGRGAAGPRPRA